jgi:type II secretory pathway component PulF
MLIENPTYMKLAVKYEFGAKSRQRFYTKLGQLLENGVPLDTALQQLQNASKKTRGSVLPILFGKWRRNVANGLNFGDCLSPYVPSAEAILLETGASSGHMAEALHNAANTVKQQALVKGAIISNSAYPLLLVCMLIAALLLASNVVIPTFTEILPAEEWEGMSRYVALSANFIKDYGGLMLFLMLTLVAFIAFSLPRWTDKSRMLFENIIPWNLYRMWQGSAFLLSVSAIMSAGVKIDEVSLGKIARNADPYLAQRINAVKRWVVSGANFGEALHQAGYVFPDDEIISDLRIYARLRDFDKNLVRITRTWVEELVEKVSTIMKVLNVVILFAIAIIIGVLISALYGVVQQIQVNA